MTAIFVCIIAVLLVGLLSFPYFFRKKGELKKCLYYWLKRNAISSVDGDLEEDHSKSLKLGA